MTVTIQIIRNQINAILGLIIILIIFAQQYRNSCLGRNDSLHGRTEFWESLRISFCDLKRERVALRFLRCLPCARMQG